MNFYECWDLTKSISNLYTYSSMPDISPRHLAFEKKNSIQDSLSCPTHLWEKKKFCPRRSYHVLPISKNGSFYTGKSKTFIKNFQDIPRHIIPSHLLWPKISRTFIFFKNFCPRRSYYVLPLYWRLRSKYLPIAKALRFVG